MKADYVLRSLSKISYKKWEHYAINRIYHRLDDLEIEFICQQCIRKNDNENALADFFLPQLGIYLEIHEGYHAKDAVIIADAKRRFDIAEATGLTEHRISAVNVSMSSFNEQIDAFVDLVRRRKSELVANGSFRHWDFEHRYTAKPHLSAGFLEIGPDAAFRTQKDALNCFGYGGGNYQRGVWNIPETVRDQIGLEGNCMVWFPRLYAQKMWDNKLADDGELIVETRLHSDALYFNKWDTRVVMARSRDQLNRTLYRFVGVFEPMREHDSENEHRFRRISTHVKTVSI